MSAPQTNLERQKRRHAGPIIGMVAVVIFALGLLFFYMTYLSANGQPGEISPNVPAAASTDTGSPVTAPAN